MPEPSLVEALLVEVRDDVRAMDTTLRGEGGRNGLVAKVNALMERVARLEELQRLKILPAPSEETVRTRWRAITEICIALAALTSLALQLLPGATP